MSSRSSSSRMAHHGEIFRLSTPAAIPMRLLRVFEMDMVKVVLSWLRNGSFFMRDGYTIK